MKKSIRILSLLMAFAMLIGSFSVLGNAYAPYKDSAVKYNDVDAPEFTSEQYASMALDELDRMLLKEKMEVDIYIGKLDLGSVDTTLGSVVSLVASVQNLLPLLGDASALPQYIEPITSVRRSTHDDTKVIEGLFDFIANLAPLVEKYAAGTVSLGIMTSFVADYLFDVRELIIGLIFGMTAEGKAMGELDEDGNPEGFDYMDDGGEAIPDKYKNPENGALTLAQTLLNGLVLGEWKLLDPYFEDPYYPVTYDFYGLTTKPDTNANDYYGWVHPDDWVTVGLGGVEVVAQGAAAPAADYSLVDIGTDRIGYDFIEALLRAAYNNLLIPVLNRDTVRWVRRDICGIEYLEKYTNKNVFGDDPSTPVVEGENGVEGVWYPNPDYDPSYSGEAFDRAELEKNTVLAKLFDLENAVRIPTATIPSDTTVVDYFNTLLGDVLHAVALEEVTVDGVTYDWTWDYGTNPKGDNSLLFDNIVEVGKFVLQVTGSEFFGARAFKEAFPTAAEIEQMNSQQIVSLVLRGVLNASVDYIYVEPEHQTIVDVAYRAVEQLAYQDIPQFDYTKPVKTAGMTDEQYYDAVIDKMITILFDIAVYNLNQGMDMVPEEGKLLEYNGDEGHYSDLLGQVAAWAFSEYAPLLSICDDLLCYNAEGEADGITEDMVWQDLDTIIDSLIPIKGGEGKAPWIAAEIAGDGSTIVSKAFIFDFIVKPVYTLDATNLATIFKKNPTGAFSTMDGVEIIISLLNNVFNLLFPGVFQAQDTLDEIINNELLGGMVADLIRSLGTKSFTSASGATIQGRAKDIILVGLPLVCMLLGLSDDQEFEEMEIYLPETLSATGTLPAFEVINGSSGINTYHTPEEGDPIQDKLYEYEIENAVLNQYNAAGNQVYTLNYAGIAPGSKIPTGGKLNVTFNGSRNVGDLIEFTVNYYVLDESGERMTTSYLSKTVYSYVGNAEEDDSNITIYDSYGDREVQYEDTIYLASGDDLTDIEGYSIRIRDDDKGNAATAAITGVSMTGSNPADLAGKFPFVKMNDGSDDSKPVSQSMTGQEGIYFFSPFMVNAKADGSLYERYEDFYAVDEETGELILDGNGKPQIVGNNAGVEDGQYNVTTTLNVGGATATVNTTIHLYDDYGLEGMFSRAVTANRQKSNYNTVDFGGVAEGYWTTYKNVLNEAARLALMPKEGDTFLAAIAAKNPSKYDNRYEELAEELEAAIAILEEYARDTGISGLWNAVDEVSGMNYVPTYTDAITADGQPYTIVTKEDIEYYESNYRHFGFRDYVPHTYVKYRDARSLATDIIDSQEFFAPEDPREIEYYVPSADEIAEYERAMAEYVARRLDLPAVNSIEATYAIHMIELTSDRLIRLPGYTNKLQQVFDIYGNINTASGTYVGESKANYDNAVAFADKVLKMADPLPSMINTATTMLVDTWKDLEVAGDYSKVDSALANAKAIFDACGNDPAAQYIYTEETYRTFAVAYNDALRASEQKPYTPDEQTTIDAIAQTLVDAQAALQFAGSAGGDEASVEFKTEDQFLYWDHDYGYSFVPRVTTGTLNHEYYFATLPDGTPVDGYVVGYGVYGLYDENSVLAAFDMTNCTAEVTKGGATYSTGTVIQFKDNNSGSVVKTYIVVVIGDTNCDNTYDGSDANQIAENAAWKTDWEWGGTNEEYKAVAADVTNDGLVDVGDCNAIRYCGAYKGTINQEVGLNGASSYIAY